MSFWMNAAGHLRDRRRGRRLFSGEFRGRTGSSKEALSEALEIISEAVRHVPDHLLAQESSIAWPDIRSIGNLIRHEYHRVEPAIVWSVVVDDLTPLRDA